MKPHQRTSVLWALRGGRRGVFARFGLGKTAMQLEWCNQLQKHEGGQTLIVMPLNVMPEFRADAVNLLGMQEPPYCRTMAEVKASDAPIILTNYERVRDGDIDPHYFTAVSLDEAATLRSFGSSMHTHSGAAAATVRLPGKSWKRFRPQSSRAYTENLAAIPSIPTRSTLSWPRIWTRTAACHPRLWSSPREAGI